MKKLYSFAKLNFYEKSLTYTTFLLIVYLLSRFIYFSQNSFMKKQNFYDLLISIFSNYLALAYFIFIIFILFIYSIGSKKVYYQYVLLRFKSRRQWYNFNVLLLLISSIGFTLFIVIQCILESIFTLGFKNTWSEYSVFLISKYSLISQYDNRILTYIEGSISPLSFVLINIFFFICFLFVLAMIYFILSLYLRKKSRAFISVFIINCINIFGYSSEKIIIRRLSWFYNLIILSNYEGKLDMSIIYYRFYYWSSLIIIIYLIGYLVNSKIDFKFGDNV